MVEEYLQKRFFTWSLVLIVSLVLTGLCMRSLAVQGIPYYQSLSTRGVICLLLTLVFGLKNGLSLLPKNPRVQLIRALVAGVALTFFTISYNWLTASAVSVLSNIDVPLLIVLGPLIGVKASFKTRSMALISISFLVIYICGLEKQLNLVYGLGALGIGSILLCFGYMFIKKSMNEENEAVTIAVPSLAIIVYGLVQGWVTPVESVEWTSGAVVEAVLAGVGMFGAYIATMRLYSITDIASAEFPGLLSSIVIQPIEALLLGTHLGLTYFLSSAFFVAVIYFIIMWQNKYEKVANA